MFAGQRDDPFFVDLGRDVRRDQLPQAGTGAEGGGKDDLAGYGVHSIVLQVPEEKVTRDGDDGGRRESDSNAVVGVWASTERKRVSVLATSHSDDDDRGDGDYVQVSRLGNPLVNEVIIPLGKKDRFNRTTPDSDAELYGKYVVKPELARVMNALFRASARTGDRPRRHRPGRAAGPSGPEPADQGQAGRHDQDQPGHRRRRPTRTASALLGGDLAGYPNGRRLTDDVVDIDLRVVAGESCPKLPPARRPQCPNSGDRDVDQNDKPFLSQVPVPGGARLGLRLADQAKDVPSAP